MENSYLPGTEKLFHYYKMLADRSIERLNPEQLFWTNRHSSNSVAVIMRHMSGNMLSRFTDFLTSDGEKTWRNRDAEFDPSAGDLATLHADWARGWSVLFDALAGLKEEDLGRIVYIRNEGHTVLEAVNRQLAHYSYHVGQIVFVAKMLADHWSSLSIPINASEEYNAGKFSAGQVRSHFTDGLLGNPPGTK